MSFSKLVFGMTTLALVTSEPLNWPVTAIVPMEATLVGLAMRLTVISMGVPTLQYSRLVICILVPKMKQEIVGLELLLQVDPVSKVLYETVQLTHGEGKVIIRVSMATSGVNVNVSGLFAQIDCCNTLTEQFREDALKLGLRQHKPAVVGQYTVPLLKTVMIKLPIDKLAGFMMLYTVSLKQYLLPGDAPPGKTPQMKRVLPLKLKVTDEQTTGQHRSPNAVLQPVQGSIECRMVELQSQGKVIASTDELGMLQLSFAIVKVQLAIAFIVVEEVLMYKSCAFIKLIEQSIVSKNMQGCIDSSCLFAGVEQIYVMSLCWQVVELLSV